MILNGWKEIAQHMGRGVRTVQRWEHFGLPVQRPQVKAGRAVVAFSDELEMWIRGCRDLVSNVSARPEQHQALLKFRSLRQQQVELRQKQALLRRELANIRDRLLVNTPPQVKATAPLRLPTRHHKAPAASRTCS